MARSPDTDDLAAALALLARGLQGAVDVAGLDHLPRPRFIAGPPGTAAAATVSAPPTTPAPSAQTQTTTQTTGTTTAPTTAPTTTGNEHPVIAATPTQAPTQPSTALTPMTMTPMTTTTRPTAEDAGALLRRIPGMSVDNGEKLRILNDDVIGDCTRCKLHRGRNKLVFGVGNPQAKLVFVGEGPGADEDREGIPFVGRAGQLLTKMINAMGFERDDVYICNVVKCRPPNNRDPEADEVEACESFLKAQLAILRPKVIVGLGRHANHTLLRTQTPISKLRGRWHAYEGVDLMPTYHPSYLLREERDPAQTKKREAWSDLQQVMKKLSG